MIPEFPENTVVEFNLNINTRAFIKSKDTDSYRSSQGRTETVKKNIHKEIMKNMKRTPDVRIWENVSAQ